MLKTTIRLLNQLLDDYGRDTLHGALEEALKQQSPTHSLCNKSFKVGVMKNRNRHPWQSPYPIK